MSYRTEHPDFPVGDPMIRAPQFGEQRCTLRPDIGMQACVALPWANCPAYSPDGRAEALHVGATIRDHVAPGFEYCLDAPVWIPAGSIVAPSFQPYWD